MTMQTAGVAPLYFSIFGRTVSVDCADSETRGLLLAGYGRMSTPLQSAVDLPCAVGRVDAGAGYSVSVAGRGVLHAAHAGEFLFLFEKELTIALEGLCPDLFFVHAAALGYEDAAIMLVAPSGSGKSTMAWALLHHGFTYLSDELSPIDLDALAVRPYAHALCLKADPPEAYALPAATLRTASTLHVPVAELPGPAAHRPYPLRAAFFLTYDPMAREPAIEPIGAGVAAARIVSNLLNGLAHPAAGLEGAIHIARAIACFNLRTADLSRTCVLVRATVAELLQP
jgi:hypothetical protein